MMDAHAYLSLARAVDDLQSPDVYQALLNDPLRRSACTRASDSDCIVSYDGIIDHKSEQILLC